MIGLLEVALFLAPFAAWLLWRVLSPHLPRVAIWAAAALLLTLVAGAAWTWTRPHMGLGDRYEPPHWQNGQIVPGRAVPK